MATSVNFFQPGTDAAVDANSIFRQRELAKLLVQQGQQGQQGQMVSGHYVAPSKLSYLTQLASALTGKYLGDKADASERDMGAKLQAQRAADAQAFLQAANGTPASTREVAGPLVEGQGAPTQTTAAVPGDMNKALGIALQSQNPMLQGLAPDLIKRQQDAAELKSALQAAGLGGGGPAPDAGGAMASGAASSPAGATGGASGLPPGISPQAFALSLSRNPQAQNIGKMLQEASKPQTLTEGGAIGRYGPNGQWVPDYVSPKTEPGIGVAPIAGQPGAFRANPVQGYGQAKADIAGQVAGAESAARDPYAGLVKIDTPQGPKMVTPAQARAMAQGAPGMQGPAGPTNAAERGMANEVAQVPYDPAREAAQVREMLATPGAIKDPADRMQAQQYLAKLEGPQAQGAGPGRGVQGGPGIPLQTEQSQAYATSRAKSYAEQAPKLQQAGQDAAGSLRNLDALETLYKDPNVAKGALAESFSGLKNLGASFGIDMKGLSSEQAAEAITNKMALASRSTAEGGGMPGAMSDADRKFLANMQPGLNKTPEGRAKIIDASRKVAQRQMEVANLARQYEQQNGQLDLGFDRALAEYAAQNQMFSQPPAKANLNDLLKKYR